MLGSNTTPIKCSLLSCIVCLLSLSYSANGLAFNQGQTSHNAVKVNQPPIQSKLFTSTNPPTTASSKGKKFGSLFASKSTLSHAKSVDYLRLRSSILNRAYCNTQTLNDGFRMIKNKLSSGNLKRTRSIAIAVSTFFSVWNTNQRIIPLMENASTAHAQPTALKRKMSGGVSKSSIEMNDSSTVKKVAFGVIGTSTGLVLCRKTVKWNKADGAESSLDGNETKFKEAIGEISTKSSSKSHPKVPKERSPKITVDEDCIKQTEEAEHASFKLAAAEKAVADALKNSKTPTKINAPITGIESSANDSELIKADQAVATAFKEYEEAREEYVEIEGNLAPKSSSAKSKNTDDEHETVKINEALESSSGMITEVDTVTKIEDEKKPKVDDSGSSEAQNTAKIDLMEETREQKVAKALKQPKTPDEERIIAEKYGSMSLEDRAFNILLDLGMIELTPDPDDPTYDSSSDDDLCPENKFE